KKNAKYFGYPGSASGYAAFPQANVLALVECGTHVVIAGAIGPFRKSEQALAFEIDENKLSKDMLCFAARSFYGYKLFCKYAEKCELLWRVKKTLKLKREKLLPDGSFLSIIYDSMNRKNCVPITVRVIEFSIEKDDKKKETYRLITTLLDHELYPANELGRLYHERWEEESSLREIKDFLSYNKKLIRCQRPDLVLQEIWGLLILHYIIRSTINKASLIIEEDPDILSFTSSLRIIKQFLPNFQSVGPINYDMEIQNIIYKISLTRADRSKGESNPRGVKQRLSKYPVRYRDQPLHIPIKLEMVILIQ
ncbi:MAG: transposase, partial [Deltaproteobacteria bacterium]|nr:transposase [Deltaproteobacteria bacterium]